MMRQLRGDQSRKQVFPKLSRVSKGEQKFDGGRLAEFHWKEKEKYHIKGRKNKQTWSSKYMFTEASRVSEGEQQFNGGILDKKK